MQELEGKVAVVTGSASGIGLAVAERLAGEGMRLVMADVEEDALEEAAERVRSGGADVLAVTTDVSEAESVEALARRALERFGAVHLLHNNAGVGAGGRLWEVPLSTWRWVLGVNLWGVIHGIHAFVPMMVAQDEGHVVNTASIAGLLASPGLGPYGATKHAVVAISESLHHELSLSGSKVKVSVLCPGPVSTRIIDSDRNWPERLGPRPEAPDDPALQAIADIVRQQIAAGLPPAEVAAMLADAVKKDRFWVLTHPHQGEMVRQRADQVASGRPPELYPVI